MNLFYVLSLSLSFALSLLGWGTAFARSLRIVPALPGLYRLNLGWLVLAWATALFNLLEIARRELLIGLLWVGILGGVYFFVEEFIRRRNIRHLLGRWPNVLMAGLGSLTLGWMAYETVPATHFNRYDDFGTYLPRLERILTLGLVHGSPFDFLGQSDFGAQSLLQAIFLQRFPLEFSVAFDGIICAGTLFDLALANGETAGLELARQSFGFRSDAARESAGGEPGGGLYLGLLGAFVFPLAASIRESALARAGAPDFPRIFAPAFSTPALL